MKNERDTRKLHLKRYDYHFLTEAHKKKYFSKVRIEVQNANVAVYMYTLLYTLKYDKL